MQSENAQDVFVPAPSPEAIREARLNARRTQRQAADILRVSERQFQRWEAGTLQMPGDVWRRFTMTSGSRFPADFVRPDEGCTRSWDPDRTTKRNTIENGDRVHLQPILGEMIQVRVCLDRIHDGLMDEESYGGVVVDFPGHPEAGSSFGGFFIGERVTFSADNALHVQQYLPSGLPPATPDR